MTPNKFKSKVEKMFLKSHPTASIEWTRDPILCKQANGKLAYFAQFLAKAPEYRERVMLASGNAEYTWIK